MLFGGQITDEEAESLNKRYLTNKCIFYIFLKKLFLFLSSSRNLIHSILKREITALDIEI